MRKSCRGLGEGEEAVKPKPPLICNGCPARGKLYQYRNTMWLCDDCLSRKEERIAFNLPKGQTLAEQMADRRRKWVEHQTRPITESEAAKVPRNLHIGQDRTMDSHAYMSMKISTAEGTHKKATVRPRGEIFGLSTREKKQAKQKANQPPQGETK